MCPHQSIIPRDAVFLSLNRPHKTSSFDILWHCWTLHAFTVCRVDTMRYDEAPLNFVNTYLDMNAIKNSLYSCYCYCHVLSTNITFHLSMSIYVFFFNFWFISAYLAKPIRESDDSSVELIFNWQPKHKLTFSNWISLNHLMVSSFTKAIAHKLLL